MTKQHTQKENASKTHSFIQQLITFGIFFLAICAALIAIPTVNNLLAGELTDEEVLSAISSTCLATANNAKQLFGDDYGSNLNGLVTDDFADIDDGSTLLVLTVFKSATANPSSSCFDQSSYLVDGFKDYLKNNSIPSRNVIADGHLNKAGKKLYAKYLSEYLQAGLK